MSKLLLYVVVELPILLLVVGECRALDWCVLVVGSAERAAGGRFVVRTSRA